MEHTRNALKRWRRQFSGTGVTTALIVCLLLTLAEPLTPVHAATLTVTKLTDDNTAGTLRKAITDAAPGDTITFQNGLSGTIALTDQLVVEKKLTIQGPAANVLTLKGNGKIRAIFVRDAGDLTLSGVTVTGGKVDSGFVGAGLANDGTLTITNCIVTDNTAVGDGGGIYNAGTLTVTGSTISGNTATGGGAGIYNNGFSSRPGTVTVTSSTISGNSANGGGGIYNSGILTVANSTISGNTAADVGGGIASGSASLTITNSTLSGNTANGLGGGAVASDKTFTARNVTVANNKATSMVAGNGGGGLSLSGTIDLGNMLLTGNTAVTGFDLQLVNAKVTNRGNNFIRNIAGDFPMMASDIIGSEATVIGPLTNNGGPTRTHALLDGSAPVDKGSNALCAEASVGNKDQRGVTRPQGVACDIGAFELGAAAPMPMMAMAPVSPAMNMMPAMVPVMAMTPAMACTPPVPGSPFALPAFQSQWNQGEGLTPNFWGPTVTASLMESYVETGGQRLVQYFDKGRMERGVNDLVTNGLLANELITGQMQVGDNAFMARGAANIPVAGDPDNAGPTYAGLGSKGQSLFTTTPSRMGTVVTTTVAADSTVTANATMMGSGATAVGAYDATTQHNVPQAFADYRAKAGLSSIGLAKSEPFVTMVKVGGCRSR